MILDFGIFKTNLLWSIWGYSYL